MLMLFLIMKVCLLNFAVNVILQYWLIKDLIMEIHFVWYASMFTKKKKKREEAYVFDFHYLMPYIFFIRIMWTDIK